MFPTLLIGDHLFVNKFLYGVKIPFSDVRLPGFREPERGDVVVFTVAKHGAQTFPADRRTRSAPRGVREADRGTSRRSHRGAPRCRLRQRGARGRAPAARGLPGRRGPHAASERGDPGRPHLPHPRRSLREAPPTGSHRGGARALPHAGRQPRPLEGQPGLGHRASGRDQGARLRALLVLGLQRQLGRAAESRSPGGSFSPARCVGIASATGFRRNQRPLP